MGCGMCQMKHRYTKWVVLAISSHYDHIRLRVARPATYDMRLATDRRSQVVVRFADAQHATCDWSHVASRRSQIAGRATCKRT
ncbi:hypothetical protein Bca4012_045552 [Brassica carinata]